MATNYCVDCLRGTIQTAINDKQATTLKCLDRQCKRPIEINDLRKIVYDKNKQNAVNDIQMQEWLTAQANIKHCRTTNCQFSFVNERADQFTMQCPGCKQEYCGQCLYAHNPLTTCQRARDERALAKDKNAQERATKAWEQANTKPCPRCNARIEKNGGCNHMNCQKCGFYFCWQCLEDARLPNHGSGYCQRTRAARIKCIQPAKQQEEQITTQNQHQFFARDPRGYSEINSEDTT